MDERVVGVIPARLEASRFPGKILADVAGEPLIRHVYERLAASALVERALVATDSPRIAEAVRSFGGDVLIVEGTFGCGSDRVAAAVAGIEAPFVVNLQGDQPLIAPEDIDRTIGAVMDDGGADISTLAYGSNENSSFMRPDSVKVVRGADGRALYFSRAPIPFGSPTPGNVLYLHHVGIYCFRRETLERFVSLPRGELESRESLEQLRALENGMVIDVVVTDRATPSVDRPEDIPSVERLLSSP